MGDRLSRLWAGVTDATLGLVVVLTWDLITALRAVPSAPVEAQRH